MQIERERILILGAAGRDFHNFNTCFRDNPNFEVVGFTAAQIPHIENRIYPPQLSGNLYPEGLPIWPEASLERIILEQKVDRCILAYSDLYHVTVMNF
jgi:predicted GTPase